MSQSLCYLHRKLPRAERPTVNMIRTSNQRSGSNTLKSPCSGPCLQGNRSSAFRLISLSCVHKINCHCYQNQSLLHVANTILHCFNFKPSSALLKLLQSDADFSNLLLGGMLYLVDSQQTKQRQLPLSAWWFHMFFGYMPFSITCKNTQKSYRIDELHLIKPSSLFSLL